MKVFVKEQAFLLSQQIRLYTRASSFLKEKTKPHPTLYPESKTEEVSAKAKVSAGAESDEGERAGVAESFATCAR